MASALFSDNEYTQSTNHLNLDHITRMLFAVSATNFLTPLSVSYVMIEVCPVCYKFLQTIYDKKRMKEIKLIDNQPCRSMYHKKLVD